jgi:predicted transcriptional regulator
MANRQTLLWATIAVVAFGLIFGILFAFVAAIAGFLVGLAFSIFPIRCWASVIHKVRYYFFSPRLGLLAGLLFGAWKGVALTRRIKAIAKSDAWALRWAKSSDLTVELACLTLLDMKTSTLTIRLDKDLNELLTKASRRSGKNRSEVAREALRRQLRISQFEALRRKIMPFAEARGYLTDEDVFADVS